jgi:hypothetical protein
MIPVSTGEKVIVGGYLFVLLSLYVPRVIVWIKEKYYHE